MALELNDGKVTGSSSIAKAGLTLGIIGTGLAALSGQNGNGFLSNLFGGGTSNEISDLKTRIALAEQAQVLNREYDNMARDYMLTIMNNKIDYCCEKAAMQTNFDKQLGDLADASILSYVNSNFIPAQLYLSASSIVPTLGTTTVSTR